jgi:regulator of replication initiation timing
MTEKTSAEKLVETLLKSIEPSEIADESLRRTVSILLNLIEQLQAETKELRSENQRLKDENNRLKGEQGKPEVKANGPKKSKENYSS